MIDDWLRGFRSNLLIFFNRQSTIFLSVSTPIPKVIVETDKTIVSSQSILPSCPLALLPFLPNATP